MTPNPTDRDLARLRDDWPRWEFWTVRKHIGGTTWCARRIDDRDAVPARVLNAASAAELAEYLEDEAGR